MEKKKFIGVTLDLDHEAFIIFVIGLNNSFDLIAK